MRLAFSCLLAASSVACAAPSGSDLDRPASTFVPPTASTGGTTIGGTSGPTLDHAQALVGRAGGRVATKDGSGVDIPPGALAAGVSITVERVAGAPVPEGGTPVSSAFLFGPEGQAFEQPVTITLAFDPSKLEAGETASDVVLYTSPRDRVDYVALGTTVVDATHVSARASHFSYYVAMHGALASGEYESTASDVGESPYIGDWKASGGYVLGYLVPGAKIYAKTVTDDSVYGLIPNAGYGGWDGGHHCGWVQLGKGTHIRGSGSSSPVAATCPAWNNDFSLDHQNGHWEGPGDHSYNDKTLFREGSWVNCDGCVQPAVVLPTCSDFTVYANYEPLTQTFSGADGVEIADRGTIDPSAYVSPGGVRATNGYSGFGTRFVSADGYAVEIKDTRRPTKKGESPTSSSNAKVTAFGFMKADCIAGSQVGNPAGSWPPAVPTCGVLKSGGSLGPAHEIVACNRDYWFDVSPEGELDLVQRDVGLKWQVKGRSGDRLDMQSDGNLVLYSGSKAIWATMTNGHPGAYLMLGDDGSLGVYYGATRLWTAP